jgi:hypothetical protein
VTVPWRFEQLPYMIVRRYQTLLRRLISVAVWFIVRSAGVGGEARISASDAVRAPRSARGA